MRRLLILLFFACPAFAFPLVDRTPGAVPLAAIRSALGTNGSVALAVWAEPTSNSIRWMRIDSLGRPLDAVAGRIADTTPEMLAVASDGQDFLIVWTVAPRTFAVPLRGGTELGGIVSFPEWGPQVQLAWGGTSYVLQLVRGMDVRVVALDPRGNPLRMATVAAPAQGIMSANLAATPFTVISFWTAPGDAKVHAADVRPSAILDGLVVPQPADPPSAIDTPHSMQAGCGPSGCLVAWVTAGRVTVRVLNGAGQPLGQRIDIPDQSFTGATLPFWNGSSYTLLYTTTGVVSDVKAIRVSADGALVDAVPFVLVSSRRTLIGAALLGSNAVVTFREDRVGTVPQVYSMVVVPPATLAGSPDVVVVSRGLPGESAKGAAWTGEEWVAVWTEQRAQGRVAFGRIARDGTRRDPGGILLDPLRSETSTQSAPAVATSGNESLVVWYEEESSFFRIRAAIVPRSAGRPAITPFLISSTASQFAEPAVVWDGAFYVVAWRNAARQIVAVRVNGSGQVLDPTPIALTELPPPQPAAWWGDTAPRLAVRGDEYLLVWQREQQYFLPFEGPPLYRHELWAQRLSKALTPKGSALPLSGNTENGFDASGHSVAADPSGYLIAWVVTGSGTTTLRGLRTDDVTARPMNFGAHTGEPTSVAWNGEVFLLAAAKSFITISTDARSLGRTTAIADGYLAAVASGPAALVLSNAVDPVEKVTVAAGRLLMADRRRGLR